MSWLRGLLWPLTGALGALAFLSLPSIGILVMPVAIVAGCAAVAWGDQRYAVALLIAGVGVMLLSVAAINAGDYHPCTNGPVILRPGQREVECGGVNPLPWAVAGLALIAGSVVAGLRMRR
jgi:hypothetical protein